MVHENSFPHSNCRRLVVKTLFLCLLQPRSGSNSKNCMCSAVWKKCFTVAFCVLLRLGSSYMEIQPSSAGVWRHAWRELARGLAWILLSVTLLFSFPFSLCAVACLNAHSILLVAFVSHWNCSLLIVLMLLRRFCGIFASFNNHSRFAETWGWQCRTVVRSNGKTSAETSDKEGWQWGSVCVKLNSAELYEFCKNFHFHDQPAGQVITKGKLFELNCSP